jgi:hypothetical protein
MTYVEHDLSADELAFLVGRLNRRPTASVRGHVSDLGHIVVSADYTDIVEATAERPCSTARIVRALHDGMRAQHDKRSAQARRAAITRAKRKERLVYEAARALKENRLTPRDDCRCCGRWLSDPESKGRGIGSECWQQVLAALKQRADKFFRASQPPMLE